MAAGIEDAKCKFSIVAAVLQVRECAMMCSTRGREGSVPNPAATATTLLTWANSWQRMHDTTSKSVQGGPLFMRSGTFHKAHRLFFEVERVRTTRRFADEERPRQARLHEESSGGARPELDGVQPWLRRFATKPTQPRPASSRAMLAGSGTAETETEPA